MLKTGYNNKSTSGSSRSLVPDSGVLFDTSSTDSISAEFEVKGCPIQIIALDLADGDVLQLERVFELPGCQDLKRTTPVTVCCGKCVQSMYRNGDKFVDTSWVAGEGRYRLVYTSGMPGSATVFTHADALAERNPDVYSCSSGCECSIDLCELIEDQFVELGVAVLGSR